MSMRSALSRTLAVLFGLVMVPASALAQASITGVVKDSSGAVLPGVTVEAASPVLIERVRTAVTDNSGQYRIAELLPGVYTLTFSLSGFTTLRRNEVDISGSGVIPISVDMRVGALAETVTVTGESPLVDTQTTRREV